VKRIAQICVIATSAFVASCGKRENISIENNVNENRTVSMHVIDLGFQYDVYLTLKKDGNVVWKDKHFDSRDVLEDVKEAYAQVEWHDDYILLRPGRLKGMPKISLKDGSFLGYELNVAGK
jgi:hypothetical protein